MSTLKRRRSENAEIDLLCSELEGSVGREDHIVTQRLRDLVDAIDPTDSSYEAQKRIASDSLVSALMRLLEEDGESVKAETARAIAALTAHSNDARHRLSGLKKTTTMEVVEKASLNPIQSFVAETDGLIGELLTMKFSEDPEVSEAGEDALNALSAYNRDAQLAILQEAVHRLQTGEPKALEAVDGLITGLEVRDDVEVLLDQALQPVMSFLRSGTASEKFDAVTLLGSLLEARSSAAKFLLAEGALAAVAALLVKGDLQTCDAAAHTAWLLVRDAKRMLSPAKDALGVAGTQLVEPLMAVVKAGAEAEEAEAEAGADFPEEEPEEDSVENSDDALLLLKALASQDPEVRAAIADEPLDTKGSCSIM